MPSAKKAFSFSWLRLSNGRTAMLLSGIARLAFKPVVLERSAALNGRRLVNQSPRVKPSRTRTAVITTIGRYLFRRSARADNLGLAGTFRLPTVSVQRLKT